MKSQVTFTCKPVVWFDIRGKNMGPGRIHRDDENVVGKFMKWLCDQDFFPARMQLTGGGQWLGAFWPEDVETVIKCLAEHDTGQVDEHSVKR